MILRSSRSERGRSLACQRMQRRLSLIGGMEMVGYRAPVLSESPRMRPMGQTPESGTVQEMFTERSIKERL